MGAMSHVDWCVVPSHIYYCCYGSHLVLCLITYVYLYDVLLIAFSECQPQWHVTMSTNYIKRDCLFHHSGSLYPT